MFYGFILDIFYIYVKKNRNYNLKYAASLLRKNQKFTPDNAKKVD